MRFYHQLLAFGVLTALFLIVAGGGAQDAGVVGDSEAAFTPGEVRLAAGQAEGRAALTPSMFKPATVGDYRVRVTVGRGGIAVGGGLRVAFPKAWFTNPLPLRKPVQKDDPSAPHFIGAEASRAGARLSLEIDHINFLGQVERFTRMATVTLAGAALREGDSVTVVFAGTTAPFIAGMDEVTVAIDAAAKGEFRKLRRGARYEVLSGEVAEITLVGPSQAVVGQPATLQITAFDKFYNVSEDLLGTFRVTGLDGQELVADLGTAESGKMAFTWTPTREGFFWPVASSRRVLRNRDTRLFGQFEVVGNPIRVFSEAPDTKIYWGDLHSHSRLSQDAIGFNDFDYARDVARLDFFASSEHADDDSWLNSTPRGDSLALSEWEEIKGRVREFYDPGRFVTLLAYECSLPAPIGHHNVYYRSVDGLPWPAHRVGTEHDLWAKLKAGEAITVPHHMGIGWGGLRNVGPLTGPELQAVPTGGGPQARGPAIDWTRTDNRELRPLLEIYSMHGSSEFYDPQDALAYERVDFTSASSTPGKHYAQDGWLEGRRLGVIAASDNHTSQPGQRHGGLAAVMAPALTREAIFDALRDRATYATTGERVYLEFEIGGAKMGGRTEGAGDGLATARVLVAAPYEIARAEVLAMTAGAEEFRTVKQWKKPGKLLEDEFEVEVDPRGSAFYLRLELSEQVRERPIRAWSSPVWIDP